MARALVLSFANSTLSLPADTRFERALQILDQNEDLATTTDQETLGLAGGLFKAKWEVSGQVQDLQRSLMHYGKAGLKDQTTTAIPE